MNYMLVQSTNLQVIGYDEQTATLEIQFKNGMLYRYNSVAPDVYSSMMASGDPGRYFAEIIKPQRYTMPYTKLGVMPLIQGQTGTDLGLE